MLVETVREYAVVKGPTIELGEAIDSACKSYGFHAANLYMEKGHPEGMQLFLDNSDIVVDLLSG